MDPHHRCGTCILPEKPPVVCLDDAGTCSYCRAFEKTYAALDGETLIGRQAQFERRLSACRRKTRPYDCLVPVSGGKDSMYVLYTCVKTYNMNVLAFNFDNGFQSARAAANVDTAIRLLGVDFVKLKPSEATLFALYRTFLTRTGSFCAPCNLIIGEGALRIAKQYGISTIVTGNSRRWSAAIHGMSISKYANIPFFYNVVQGYIDGDVTKNLVRNKYVRDVLMGAAGLGVKTVDLFEYVNPTKEALLETLRNELGWEPPSGGLEHGDCLVNPVKDYLVCRKWGFSEITGGYATQVRNGKMSRDEALRRAEAEEQRDEPPLLGVFLEKIGLARADFEQAVDKAHFTDYSNAYGGLYRLTRRLANVLK